MDVKLSKFVESLKSLKETIDSATINEAGFQAHGWNQVHLSKDHISFILQNYIAKLVSYGELEITRGLDETIDKHNEIIDQLNTNSKSYFTDNASHLLHAVPDILLTLQAIFSDIDYELFSYENIQDKKLLPRGLNIRLRSAKTVVVELAGHFNKGL